MIFFSVVIGLVIMAAMIYLALDKKSNKHTRIASIAALGIMIFAVIICLGIILTDNRVPIDPSNLIVGAPPVEPQKSSGIVGLLISIVFLLALFLLIAFLARKEHKKSVNKKKDSALPI